MSIRSLVGNLHQRAVNLLDHLTFLTSLTSSAILLTILLISLTTIFTDLTTVLVALHAYYYSTYIETHFHIHIHHHQNITINRSFNERWLTVRNAGNRTTYNGWDDGKFSLLKLFLLSHFLHLRFRIGGKIWFCNTLA